MMKQAALELAKDRIRVNTVHPGFTDTPMMRRIHESAIPHNPQAVEDALSAGIPMRRYGTSDEIATLMLFLASDAASYCTGGTYTADGGLLSSWGPTPH
jgi:NAD(P)-dependent dehydrogenase (short-subunit alcohol dehydrogenase family)